MTKGAAVRGLAIVMAVLVIVATTLAFGAALRTDPSGNLAPRSDEPALALKPSV